jgi:hypothetical protein
MSIIPFGKLENRSYFFDHGLRFSCQQCGDCCVGEHGTIYVSRPEIEAIAASRHISVDDFTARYLYPYNDSFSIKEDAKGRCLFFENGCAIYDIRPRQCRTFPFWFSTLRSEAVWRRVGRQCPGIGRGRLYTKSEILDLIVQSMPI